MGTPLTPTTVTDKNGRVTTVHKRQDAHGSSKPLSVPAPALAPKSVSSAAAKPLTPPVSITEEQSEEVRAWQHRMLNKSIYNTKAKAACMKPLDPESEALVWRVIKAGRVHEEALASIINRNQLQRHMFKGSDAPLAELRASLRVAERVGELAPSVADISGSDLGMIVYQAMRGYGYSPKEENRSQVRHLATEEELAAVAAVTIFLANADNGKQEKQFKQGDYRDADGRTNSGMWMTNHSLKAYIVENPESIHRVLDYMNTRSVGKSIKDTRAIIQYVEESKELGALDQGWL